MKSMAAELNMFQAQCSEYKYEIERLTTELIDLKKQYYETKRRESLTREIWARKTLQIKDVLNKENFNTLNSSLPDITLSMPRSTRNYHSRHHSHRLTGGGFPIQLQ